MVHILNAAHPKKSTLSYDPIASIESYADIEALSAAIVDMSIRKSVDDYWQVKAKQLLGPNRWLLHDLQRQPYARHGRCTGTVRQDHSLRKCLWR